MLEIQKFLQTASPADLTAQLGIKVKPHPKHSNLLHFSYDQLESPKAHPIVHECRGLILDSTDNWKVVAYPFKRFANYGETWGPSVDWTSVRVQEKVDGSLMVFWFYLGEWFVSTKGSPDAGGNVGDFDFTFAELFWKTLSTKYLEHDGTMETAVGTFFDPEQTYMIELTSIYNRVVCSYGKESQLTLIGVRDIAAYPYPERPVHQFNSILPIVKEYPLQSVDDVVKAAEVLDPIHNEGFVVLDKNFNRCKIKSPAYVMIHHMKDGFGQRRIIRLIQLGEQSEVLSYFPEYMDLFAEIKEKIIAKLAEIDADWTRLQHLTDRKTFALEAVKTTCPDVLFALFSGQATDVTEYVLHSKKVIRKATETTEAIEDFRFPEYKIEGMVGLKSRPDVTVEE